MDIQTIIALVALAVSICQLAYDWASSRKSK